MIAKTIEMYPISKNITYVHMGAFLIQPNLDSQSFNKLSFPSH